VQKYDLQDMDKTKYAHELTKRDLASRSREGRSKIYRWSTTLSLCKESSEKGPLRSKLRNLDMQVQELSESNLISS